MKEGEENSPLEGRPMNFIESIAMPIPEHVTGTNEEPSLLQVIDNLEKETSCLRKEISQLESQLVTTISQPTQNKDATHPFAPVELTPNQKSKTTLEHPTNLNRKFYEFTGVAFKRFSEDSVTACFYPKHSDDVTARPYRVTFDRNNSSVLGYDLPFMFDMPAAVARHPISSDLHLMAFVDHVSRCCDSYFDRRQQVLELQNAVDNKYVKVFPDMQYLLIQIRLLATKSKPEIQFSIWYNEDAILPHRYIVRIADAAYKPLGKTLTEDLEVLYKTPLPQAFTWVMEEVLRIESPSSESDSEDDSSEPDWLQGPVKIRAPQSNRKRVQGKTAAKKVENMQRESDDDDASVESSEPHLPPSKKSAKSSKLTKRKSLSTKRMNVDGRSDLNSTNLQEHENLPGKSRQDVESRKGRKENKENTEVTTKPAQSLPKKSTQTSIINFFKTGNVIEKPNTITSVPRKNGNQPILHQNEFDSDEGEENGSICSTETAPRMPRDSPKVVLKDNDEALSLTGKIIDINDSITIQSQQLVATLASIGLNVDLKRKLFTESTNSKDSTDERTVECISDKDRRGKSREAKEKGTNYAFTEKDVVETSRGNLDGSAMTVSARNNATKDLHTNIAGSTSIFEKSNDISCKEPSIKDVINTQHTTQLEISPKEVPKSVMVSTLDVASIESTNMLCPKLMIPLEIGTGVLQNCSETKNLANTSQNLNETNNTITSQFNSINKTTREVDLSLKQLEADLETVLDEATDESVVSLAINTRKHVNQKSFDQVFKDFIDGSVSRRSVKDKAMEWMIVKSDEESCVGKTTSQSSQIKKPRNKGREDQVLVSKHTGVENPNLAKNPPIKGRNKRAKISQQKAKRSDSDERSDDENPKPVKNRPIKGRNQQAKISQQKAKRSDSNQRSDDENPKPAKNRPIKGRNQQAKISQQKAKRSDSDEHSDNENPHPAKKHPARGRTQHVL